MNKSDVCFPIPVSDSSITNQVCSRPLRTKFVSLFSKYATEFRVCQFSVFDDPLQPQEFRKTQKNVNTNGSLREK